MEQTAELLGIIKSGIACKPENIFSWNNKENNDLCHK